jgi:hypothetical protein
VVAQERRGTGEAGSRAGPADGATGSRRETGGPAIWRADEIDPAATRPPSRLRYPGAAIDVRTRAQPALRHRASGYLQFSGPVSTSCQEKTCSRQASPPSWGAQVAMYEPA